MKNLVGIYIKDIYLVLGVGIVGDNGKWEGRIKFTNLLGEE
jgi:hypothetical protein